jgi:hypothetical protein
MNQIAHVFKTHLECLLPLRNASYSVKNGVLEYCCDFLCSIDREPEGDRFGNMWHIPEGAPYRRGIVAHTDSVMQSGGKDSEPFIFANGVYSSKNRKRPIGGDDKVGVAIALTIAEIRPDVSIILPADEEVGCIGSSELVLPDFELLVQCDRRGISDVVTNICGPMCSSQFEDWLEQIMSWRRVTSGMMTDVQYLSRFSGNSVNLSCGYYNPHSVDEIIVLSQAIQTLNDALMLIDDTPAGIAGKPEGLFDDIDYWGDEKDSEWESQWDREYWRSIGSEDETGRLSIL